MNRRQEPRYQAATQFRRVPQYDNRREFDPEQQMERRDARNHRDEMEYGNGRGPRWNGLDADEIYGGSQGYEANRRSARDYDDEIGSTREWDFAQRDDASNWNREPSFSRNQNPYRSTRGYAQNNLQHGYNQEFRPDFNRAGSVSGNDWRFDDSNLRNSNDRSQEFQARNERGQFTGRGPKGYRRSDERIAEDVNEALAQHPDLDASEIEVKVQNGDVTLSGTVEDRRYKRMAEDAAERCSGVNDVHNQIRVQREDDRENSSTQGRSKANGGIGSKSSETRTS